MTRYDRLMGTRLPQKRHAYSQRDTILYALGTGAGSPPYTEAECRLVHEPELVALPSMAVTLAVPGFWYRDAGLGLNHRLVVHASERITLSGPLPTAGQVHAQARIVAIHDKGPGRGSLIVSRREILDEADRQLAVVEQTAFCRGDGGLGGPMVAAPTPEPFPQRPPDRVETVPTDPRAALIYRLSGDPNPLHVKPAAARLAGFPRPVLHGLATYGHVCRVLMRRRGFREVLRRLECRFVGPVYPGDTLRLEVWTDTTCEHFRVWVDDRRVIDNGLAGFGEPP
jgi:acyl dehydratase